MEEWEEKVLRLQDEERFQAVWERVMEGKPNPIMVGTVEKKITPPMVATKISCFGDMSAKDHLETALSASSLALGDYQKLEKQLPQKLKSALYPLIKEVKREYNQLESAFFLLTGESHPPTGSLLQSPPVAADKRLRERFLAAQVGQSNYQKWAFASQDSCFTTLFLQLEIQKKEEVQALQKLIQEFFWLRDW
ncbi:MAG: hypothetical protein R3Y63_11040 [Eubacteriales bacterium]